MGSKLLTSNPYLRNPATRQRMVFTSVASSSAIEGIRAPFKELAPEAMAGSRTRGGGKRAVATGVSRTKHRR